MGERPAGHDPNDGGAGVANFDNELQAQQGGSPKREVFGSRMGFILAAVGSAVGLGNMWRFSYTASEGGGAAFVFLYILLTLFVGIPIMLAEFAVGRNARLSPVGAVEKAGGKKWSPMGMLFVFNGFIILAYYAVIAGWVIRYALEAITGGFPADPGAHFTAIASGPTTIVYHIIFMIATISIVAVGIEKGIEKTAMVLMPVLFAILIGLAIYAATLDGAGAGYAFYLKPDFSEITWAVFGQAAAQAFFSLSLGMGAMLTFASYLPKSSNLGKEATIIAFADFGVAFIAGLVVFPVIFALGLQGSIEGIGSLGALFVALPGAFVEMGPIGRWVGLGFMIALAVGAITSAVSMLEVVVASLIDQLKWPRRKAAMIAGSLITAIGIIPAMSIEWLGLFDALAGNFFLVLGALGMALLVGWRMNEAKEELMTGSSPFFQPLIPAFILFLRFIAPPLLIVALWTTIPGLREAIQAVMPS